jgi:hypothetical protein
MHSASALRVSSNQIQVFPRSDTFVIMKFKSHFRDISEKNNFICLTCLDQLVILVHVYRAKHRYLIIRSENTQFEWSQVQFSIKPLLIVVFLYVSLIKVLVRSSSLLAESFKKATWNPYSLSLSVLTTAHNLVEIAPENNDVHAQWIVVPVRRLTQDEETTCGRFLVLALTSRS